MTTQLSKADRIRKMLHLSNADIADIIGCPQSYVRSVRQRTSASGNPIHGVGDVNWMSRPDYPERNRQKVRRWLVKRRAEAHAS